jgi:hypothetical protein
VCLGAACRFEQLEQFALDHHSAQHSDPHDDDNTYTTTSSSSKSLGRRRRKPLSFHKLLRGFVRSCQVSGAYFLADMKNTLALAKLLRHLEPCMGMHTLCISPASADDGPVVQVSAGE